MCELMFEKYQTSAFFLAKDAVLSCYACGKTSGLAVDCGASGTLVVPASDGWVDMKGLSYSSVGGRYMDAYLLSLLTKRLKYKPKPQFRLIKHVITERNNEIVVTENTALAKVQPSFEAYMNLELARDIKESTCKLADSNLLDNEFRYANMPNTPYELPDGTIVDMSIERFQVPELFIDPMPFLNQQIQLYDDIIQLYHEITSPVPFTAESLPKMISNSVIRSDSDIQATLLSNIVLTGGNSCYKGLIERLKVEIERLIHINAPGWKIKLLANSPAERAICPWLGGSIMASLGSFHEIWINKKEYDEYGSIIVDRKCP